MLRVHIEETNKFPKSIDFHLPKGYILGLVGANGAGKTTLIRYILGDLKNLEGSIEICGLDITKESKTVKDKLGFVLDTCPFDSQFGARYTGRTYGPLYSQWDITKFDGLLDRFKIPHGKKLKNMSKGESVKFQLAFALSHNPDLLIMDEPTGGLDIEFKKTFKEIIYDYMSDGTKSVIYSTHLTEDLDMMGDYLLFINKGRQILYDTVENVHSNYAVIKGNKKDVNKYKDLIVGRKDEEHFSEALIKNNEEVLDSVDMNSPTIEDIMYYIIKGGE